MIFLALVHLASSECVKIECQDTYDPAFRCIEIAETIKVSACPAGMYCPSYSSIATYNQKLSFVDSYCEPLPYSPPVDLCTNSTFDKTQLPGDQCCNNNNCLSGICTNLVCDGLSQGKSCNDTSICAPGLYCGPSNICVTALKLGSKCISDLECRIGHGCNKGYCTELWSLTITYGVDDAKFCESNYAFEGYCDMIQIYLNGTKMISEPFICNLVDNCVYHSAAFRKSYDEEPCLCSGDPSSKKGYCGLYINHVEGMFENLYKDMKYSSSKCSGAKAHTSDPFELWQCGSISSTKYEKYVETTRRNQNWNLYQSGVLDGCAETITLFTAGSVLLGVLAGWVVI